MSASEPQLLPRLFAEHVNTGDVDGLLDLYEPDATLITPDGRKTQGAAALRERLEALVALSAKITQIGVVEALLVGDLVLMSGNWRMSFGDDKGTGSGFEGQSTEVARRQADGSWRYVIDDPASAGRLGANTFQSIDDSTSFEQLVFEQDGPVARITLNRPERRNALSIQLSDELTASLAMVRSSTSVKALVIAGAGATFCAGDDITEMGQWGDANQIMRRVRGYQRMADALADLDKPTIAAVDGYAVGGGLEITMACDFVIATSRARWGMPEIDVGITPGWGGTTRMARLIGRRMTKEINLLGALHPATRAVELGLWNRTVPDDRLHTEVDALIEVLLSKNQQALRQLKFIIDHGVETDLHTAQGFEAVSAALTGAVNGAWKIPDADQGAGVTGFISDGEKWRTRRALARDFWVSSEPAAAQ